MFILYIIVINITLYINQSNPVNLLYFSEIIFIVLI